MPFSLASPRMKTCDSFDKPSFSFVPPFLYGANEERSPLNRRLILLLLVPVDKLPPLHFTVPFFWFSYQCQCQVRFSPLVNLFASVFSCCPSSMPHLNQACSSSPCSSSGADIHGPCSAVVGIGLAFQAFVYIFRFSSVFGKIFAIPQMIVFNCSSSVSNGQGSATEPGCFRVCRFFLLRPLIQTVVFPFFFLFLFPVTPAYSLFPLTSCCVLDFPPLLSHAKE